MLVLIGLSPFWLTSGEPMQWPFVRRPSASVVVNVGTKRYGWTNLFETWLVGTLTKTGRTFFSFFNFNPFLAHQGALCENRLLPFPRER